MRNFLTLCLVLLSLASCKDDSVKFGVAKYHPSFLWCKADTVPVEKTLQLEFSADAQTDPQRYAEFELVDTDGQLIEQSVIRMSVDSKVTENNTFRVASQDKEKKLTLLLLPEAAGGTHQGYLRLKSHNLDRLGNQELAQGEAAYAFMWSVTFEKEMNPLAKVLMWTGIVIVAVLLLWFIVLRPQIYPHFSKMRKTMLIKQNGKMVGQMSIAFTGKRAVIISSRKKEQPAWHRIFVGEIYVKVDPHFTTPLKFVPRKKNAIATGMGYVVTPNPVPRNGKATIINQQQHLEITIN